MIFDYSSMDKPLIIYTICINITNFMLKLDTRTKTRVSRA